MMMRLELVFTKLILQVKLKIINVFLTFMIQYHFQDIILLTRQFLLEQSKLKPILSLRRSSRRRTATIMTRLSKLPLTVCPPSYLLISNHLRLRYFWNSFKQTFMNILIPGCSCVQRESQIQSFI